MNVKATPVKRENFLDVCKAIGIILVVLGHTYGISDGLHGYIYSFHMPLFFVISGYLYNETKYNRMSFKDLALKKAKAYLVPYLIFAGLNFVLQILYNFVFLKTLVNGEYVLRNIKGILLCNSNMENMPNCSPIWFLVSLFVATLIFWAIIKYASKIAVLLCIFAAILSYLAYLYLDVFIPWKITTSLMAVLFLYVGYALAKYKLIEKVTKTKLFLVILISVLAIGSICAYYNLGRVGMNENGYGNLLLFLGSSVCLTIAVLILCKKMPFLDTKHVIWLGKNTMYIMAFNYFMRDFTTEIYYLVPVVRNYKIHWAVSFVLVMIGCIAASLIYNYIQGLINNNRLKQK